MILRELYTSDSVVFILFMIVCSFGVCSFVPSSTQEKTERYTLTRLGVPRLGNGCGPTAEFLCRTRRMRCSAARPTAKDSYTPWNYTPWNEHRMWTNYQMWINYQNSTCLSRMDQHSRVFYTPPKGPPKMMFSNRNLLFQGPPIFRCEVLVSGRPFVPKGNFIFPPLMFRGYVRLREGFCFVAWFFLGCFLNGILYGLFGPCFIKDLPYSTKKTNSYI